MRFDFSRLLNDIASRHRHLRGAGLASSVLLYGGGCALLLGIGARLFFPDLSSWAVLVLPALVLLGALAAYLVQWSRRPYLPSLLIRLDDQLDSKARISSLYEIRQRSGNPLIRDRLEALVEHAAQNWERGMPRPRRVVPYSSIGATLIVLAAAFVIIPLPALRTQAGLPEDSGLTAASRPITDIPSARQPELETAEETETHNPAPVLPSDELTIVDDPGSEGAHVSPPEDNLNLDSVLKDLEEMGGSSSSLMRNPDAEGLPELTEAQQQAMQTLTEMLSEMLEQMQAEGRSSLTNDEAQALQSAAAQTGNPDLQDLTDELANDAEAREDAEDALQDLLDEIEEGESTSDGIDETMEGQTDSQQQDSTAVEGDQEAAQRFLERASEELEQQGAEDVQAESPQDSSTPQSASSDPNEPSDQDSTLAEVGENPEEDTMSGGAEGTPGEDSEGPEQEPEFVREEAPSTLGSEGEFVNEFVTKGVPIETGRSTTGIGVTHRVDYTRIDSILRQRGLPDEALDAVKRYFEAISQPEGGS